MLQSGQGITGKDLFELRKACYAEIEKLRGRPLLIYATKFLDGVPPGVPNQIDLPDVDGFTDLINSVGDDRKSVDVLLHSPGGLRFLSCTGLIGSYKIEKILISVSMISCSK